METILFSNIKKYYEEITPKNIAIFDLNNNYFYVDKTNTEILVRDCWEVDIKSASLSIFPLIFPEDKDFIDSCKNITDKVERYSMMSSKYKNDFVGELNKLQIQNQYFKMFLLSFIFTKWSNITILELKKDGCVFIGNEKDIDENQFIEYCTNNDVNFHIDEIKSYFHYNKISVFQYNDNIEIKGRYKNFPKYLEKLVYDILNDEFDIYSRQEMEEVFEKYTQKYHTLLKLTHDNQQLKYYYSEYFENIFDNLRILLYPMIYLLKSE